MSLAAEDEAPHRSARASTGGAAASEDGERPSRSAAPTRAELQQENDRLRRAAKLHAELVGSVAHELRTPLTSVLGFTDLLLTRDLEPASRERYLHIVDSEVRRLESLVDDLFEVELMMDRVFGFAPEAFDLGKLLGEHVDRFRSEAGERSVLLALPSHALVVEADRDRIAQVISTLLANAVEGTPAGGTVVARGEARGGTVRISFRDDGLGVPAEKERLLFGRLSRDRQAREHAADGPGLGLGLCWQIVYSHGGSLGFDSTYGHGSTFWFDLPAAEVDDDGR